jgi:hypothetical protein
MLRVAGVKRKASYHPGEVREVLGISERTFWRLTAAHEFDPLTGKLRTPACLDSYMTQGNRRVAYCAMVEYLQRNQTYQRQNAVDPRQMDLF